MKKIFSYFTMMLCCVAAAFVFTACNNNNNDNGIKIKSISVNKSEINLVVGENELGSEEFVVSYKPFNATQNQIEFFSYNQNLIDIDIKQGTTDTFVVTAKPTDKDFAQTIIGIRMHGNTEVQTNCTVKISKVSTPLSTPTNLRYDEQNDCLTWDSNNHSVAENGYVLLINGEKVVCPGVNTYANFEKGKQLTVQVKAKGKIDELDSGYSESLTFMVLKDVENLAHENQHITWDAVDNALGYRLSIGLNNIEFDSSTLEYYSDQLFITPGEHEVKVVALTEDETSQSGDVLCYCYNSAPSIIKVTRLSTPDNVQITQNAFKWGAVVMNNGALPEEYIIFQNDLEILRTKEISLLLTDEIEVGEHTFKVQALGDGINTLDSEVSVIKRVKKLDTPTNLRVEDGKLVWDKTLNAQKYEIKIFGTIYENNGTPVNYFDEAKSYLINQPDDESIDTIVYDMGELFEGDYRISIANAGDGQNTLTSVFTDAIDVYKLLKTKASSFTVENNKLVFEKDDKATSYNVTFTAQNFVQTLSTTQNQMELPHALPMGEFKVTVQKIGDSTKYVTSSVSVEKHAVLLGAPTLEVLNGVLKWNSVENATGYVLKINGEEKNLGTLTGYKFEEEQSGSYTLQIKAIGGNATGSNALIGSFDSNYGANCNLQKLEIPTLMLEEGTIKCSVVANVKKNVLTSKNNADGSITYYVKAQNHEGNYIDSSLSQGLTIWQIPNVSNLQIKDGYLIWDEMSYYTYGADRQTFDGAYFELQLTKTIDGQQQGEPEIINLGQNNSYNFNDTNIEAAKYKASVRIVGNSGNTGDKLFKSSDSLSQELIKLSTPELTTMDILTYISNDFKQDFISGSLKWDSQKVEGQFAVGYELILLQDSKEVYKIDVKTATKHMFDNLVKAGTYDIKIKAYGNGTDIVDSCYSQPVEFTKLNAAKNLKISNDGVLSWETDYNEAFTLIPTNRVVFVVNINGTDYVPYESLNINLSGNILESLDALKQINALRTFEIDDKFAAGTYEVYIKTLPLNIEALGHTTDLLAEKSNTIVFNKLAEPLGFRLEQDANRRHILTWTKNNNQNISGYELSLLKEGQDEKDAVIIKINDANQTTFDYSQWLEDNDIINQNYIAKIRCVTNTNGYLSSDYSKELSLSILIFSSNQLFIKNGKLQWHAVDGASHYQFDFVINKNTANEQRLTKTFTKDDTSYVVSLENDSRFVAGTYDITVKVFGSNISNYGSIAYLDGQVEAHFSFVKLNTPTNVEVENGIIIYQGNNDNYDNYYFNILISGAKRGEESNGTNTEYELPQQYPAGDYTINVQAIGGHVYLSSEVSADITPSVVTKIQTTETFVKNGILTWNPVLNTSGYVVEFSGSSYFVYDDNGEATIETGLVKIAVANSTMLDLSYKFEDENGNIIQLAQGGEYQIKVKAMGTNQTYLNASYSSLKTFIKRNDIGEISVKDGILVWKDFDNYEAQNGIVIGAKLSTESEFVNYYIDQNASYYELDERFASGTYDLFVQLLGNTNLGNGDEYFLNGNPSNIVTFEKLPTPLNARVEYSNNPTLFGTFMFDSLNANYQDIGYQLKLQIITADKTYQIVEELTGASFDIKNKYLVEGKEILLDSNTTIKLQVKALGKQLYLNSNYSTVITLNIPATPTLTVVDDNGLFTGKIEWPYDDNITKYYFTYKYISRDYMLDNGYVSKADLTPEVWDQISEVTVTVETNSAYIYNKGFYKFSIRASIVGDNNSEITSLPSDYTGIYEYTLFDNGNGSINNPFRVDTPTKFTYIKYNLTAHYEISSNDANFDTLDFSGINLFGIGSEDEMFTGSFNGNGKIMKNITLSNPGKNNGLFNYIGAQGVVKNIIIQNIIISNGTTIGGVASINYGLVDNVIVGAVYQNNSYVYDGTSNISPYLSQRATVYAGGIVGYNNGVISNSKNYSQVAPRNDLSEVYCGGITSYNQGYIKNCGNYNNIGGTSAVNNSIYSNFTGGIAAYNNYVEDIVNSAVIESCLNIASIYGKTKSVSAVSVAAYVGGIVGYNNKGLIQYCYNNNVASQIYAVTTFSTQNVYAGGLIGYNYNGGQVHYCYTISNVTYYNSSTADIKAGTIIGLNKSGNPSYLSNLYALTLSSVDNKGEGISSFSVNIFTHLSNNMTLQQFYDSILSFENSVKNVWKVENNTLKLIWE